MAQRSIYICCSLFGFIFVLFFLPTPTKSSVIIIHFKQSLNLWNSWENQHNHQLLSDRRERSPTTMLGWQIFRCTGMTLESLVSQCDLCFADHVVPGWRLEWGTENLFLKEEEVGNIQGGSENSSGHFKRHSGSRTGLPLGSILRRSLGLPATTFRGSQVSFKGSGLIRNGSCEEVFCFEYDALCSFYNSVLSDNVTFSCTLSGILVHHTIHSTSSNRFTERPIPVVLHVSSSVVPYGGWQHCQLSRCVLVASISQYEKDF